MHLTGLLRLTAIIAAALSLLSTAPILAAQKSSYQLIQDEFAKGNMSVEDRLMLEVRSIKDPASLPPALQSSSLETNKCATEILLEVRNSLSSFSADNQTLFREIMARPTRSFSYNSPGGNFKIWYNTTGTHAVPTADTAPANGIPDYVEWIGNYSDSSYRAEITNLGHLAPPSDGAAGGDARYDIYTEEMGYYGYTQPEVGGPNPWNDASSYISVHRNFIGFPANDDPEGDQKGAAKVTVAHEYYHAVQFAYDVSENVWFMEAASTWMEDQVYDPVNDNYNYCSEWFTGPDLSLHSTTGLHLYAAFIWPVYLVQTNGAAIMPQIWNELINTSPYPAFTTALATYGKTLNPQFAKFTSWNFVTGSRADLSHFEEGSHYPLISLTRTHNAYPVSGQGPLAGKAPDAMGTNYVQFNIPGDAQSITVDFNGDNTTPWVVSMMAWKSSPSDVYAESTMTLNGSGDGSYTLYSANSWNSLVMVITNVSQSLSDRTYAYGASYTNAPNVAVGVTAVADDSVYSNTTTDVSFTVQNTGVLTETYNLTAGNTAGWSVTPSAASIMLNPTQSAPVTVQVVCPAGTLNGVFDDVWLKAEATSLVGISDTDTSLVEVFIMHGDADNNGILNISDAVFDVTYIFSAGSTPIPVIDAGDADCSTIVNISDAVFLINYIFASGPPPPCNPF
ncbi:MAG: MXAN_6640 family putative metalloprotease [Candidatus Zixiibacteriota bacterium]